MARITVINDAPEFLKLMDALISDLGHTMTGFQAVHTSIEQVVATQPGLLIVDLRLKDHPAEISGWEIVILARSHRDLVSVPVILCTGDVWEVKKRAADLEQIAGVHVLTKPFDLTEMCDLIETLLAEGASSPAAETEVAS